MTKVRKIYFGGVVLHFVQLIVFIVQRIDPWTIPSVTNVLRENVWFEGDLWKKVRMSMDYISTQTY